jgi:hypothetical protein
MDPNFIRMVDRSAGTQLLLFLSPLLLVGRNIVKCERYPGTPEFDLIEGKQPKSE